MKNGGHGCWGPYTRGPCSALALSCEGLHRKKGTIVSSSSSSRAIALCSHLLQSMVSVEELGWGLSKQI